MVVVNLNGGSAGCGGCGGRCGSCGAGILLRSFSTLFKISDL